MVRPCLVSWAIVVVLVVGCQYHPTPEDGKQICAEAGKLCPDGYHCESDKTCWTNGHRPDASPNGVPEVASDATIKDTNAEVASPADGPFDVDGGIDAVGRPNGAACMGNTECALGHCVDGVCCESACLGQCSSCDEPDGGVGKCLIVTGMPRGNRAPCGGTAPCTARCDGTDGTACKYPGSDVQCSTGSCLNGSVKTATTCNGAGACTSATASTCASNQCADGSKCSGGCTAASCAVGTYCDATGVCLSGKANGDPCQSNTQCTSTFCVDSVCCSSACNGQCQACREPSNVGTCVTIVGAPRGTRAGCAGIQATCAGQCNGTLATACTYPGSTTVCTAAACSGSGSITSASTCNSSGSCSATTTTACSGGTYCNGGSCVSQAANGAPCQIAAQCQSGNCTGAICCAGGQTGCSGVCKNLAADSANCGACGKQCSGSSCVNGVLTSASSCNAGACSAGATSPCSSNQCANGSMCSGGCSAGMPCGNGKYCDATASCQPTKGNGASCTSGIECTSTFCVDGVCCSSVCSGQCQACKEPSTPGTCVTVSGAPRGGRPACAAAQASCAGQCNGTSATACSYPGSASVCTAASCTGDFTLVSTSVCNGAGACSPANPSTCNSGSYCSGGTCTTQATNGGACQRTAQCQSGNCTGSVCCASGQTGCNGVCKTLSTDTSNCGSCGHVCPNPPSNGTAVCSGSSCGVQCIDSVHCGSSCFDCRQPNANVSCAPVGSAAACANTCVGRPLTACGVVNGEPSCGSWDFESGDPNNEGWTVDTALSDAVSGPIYLSTGYASKGTHSLAIPFNGDAMTTFNAAVRVTLCAGGQSIDLSGKTFQASMFLQRTTTPSGGQTGSVFWAPNYQSSFDFSFDDTAPSKIAFSLSGSTTYITIRFTISNPWTGTIFLDDIQIN